MTFKLITRAVRRRKTDTAALRTLAPSAPNRSERSWTNFLRADLPQQRKDLVLSTLHLVEDTGSASYADSISALLEITGKRLLEVGSHYCWYAPFFLKAGCLSYHGADLEFDWGHRQISGPHGTADSPMPFADFIDSFPTLSITDCDIRDLPPGQHGFDAEFMVSTSEHFDDPHGAHCNPAYRGQRLDGSIEIGATRAASRSSSYVIASQNSANRLPVFMVRRLHRGRHYQRPV